MPILPSTIVIQSTFVAVVVLVPDKINFIPLFVSLHASAAITLNSAALNISEAPVLNRPKYLNEPISKFVPNAVGKDFVPLLRIYFIAGAAAVATDQSSFSTMLAFVALSTSVLISATAPLPSTCNSVVGAVVPIPQP